MKTNNKKKKPANLEIVLGQVASFERDFEGHRLFFEAAIEDLEIPKYGAKPKKKKLNGFEKHSLQIFGGPLEPPK